MKNLFLFRRFFLQFVGSPREFFWEVLIFRPIRSSPSLFEIRSTSHPGQDTAEVCHIFQHSKACVADYRVFCLCVCQFLGIKSYELSIFFQTLFTNKQRNREGRRDLECGLWKKGGGRIPFGFIL